MSVFFLVCSPLFPRRRKAGFECCPRLKFDFDPNYSLPQKNRIAADAIGGGGGRNFSLTSSSLPWGDEGAVRTQQGDRTHVYTAPMISTRGGNERVLFFWFCSFGFGCTGQEMAWLAGGVYQDTLGRPRNIRVPNAGGRPVVLIFLVLCQTGTQGKLFGSLFSGPGPGSGPGRRLPTLAADGGAA